MARKATKNPAKAVVQPNASQRTKKEPKPGNRAKAARSTALPARPVGKQKQATRTAEVSPAPVKPKLLSGGNPQIAKADGNAPVQAYIQAMPGWKSDVGRRLDALIEQSVPNVRKAVRWNSPFYGLDGQGWILSFHVFTRYVKVTFFNGIALRPTPPGGTAKEARWIDVHEGGLDEAQMKKWILQAAKLPGWGN
jgi:hypothetical protein